MIDFTYVFLGEEINAVNKRYNFAKRGMDFKKRIQDLNDIWLFQINENGVVEPDEILHIGGETRNYAEIKLAKGGNEIWAMTCDFSLSNQGESTPITVFETIGFRSKDEAVLVGILHLQAKMQRIINSSFDSPDKETAKRLFNLLEEQKMPQLDLF